METKQRETAQRESAEEETVVVEEKEQWFALSRAFVKRYKIPIEEKIAEKVSQLRQLREKQAKGIKLLDRRERIPTIMGLDIKYATNKENKMICYVRHEGETKIEFELRVKMLEEYLRMWGYDPILTCLQGKGTIGECVIPK